MTPLVKGLLDELRAHVERALPLAVDVLVNHGGDDEGTLWDMLVVLRALRTIQDGLDELERDIARALDAPAERAQ